MEQTNQRQHNKSAKAKYFKAIGLAAALLTANACTTAPNDARWLASTAVTQTAPYATEFSPAPPILPGQHLATHQSRFWDARRDPSLGTDTHAAPTATTQWPTQPRPNEQIFRFRTLKRN